MSLDLGTEQGRLTTKPGVLSLAIKEKAALYGAYMPFIKGGGLFIPTSKPFKIGDEVFMLLSLVDDPVKLKVVGNVIWIMHVAQNSRPQAIACLSAGILFESSGKLRWQWESMNILDRYLLRNYKISYTLSTHIIFNRIM